MPKSFFEDRISFKNLIGKKNLTGVEIGVANGVNARAILENLDIARLYLIDPWANYGGMEYRGVYQNDELAQQEERSAQKVIEQYKHKIIVLKALSEDAADNVENELDFVYIDGNHRHKYVKRDIELYYPKVRVGGMLAGHDFKSNERGVVRAVRETFGRSFQFENWDWWVIKDARTKGEI